MPLNMREMGIVSEAVFMGGHPLLIRGQHGIGKSAFVYQFAKRAGTVLGHDEAEFEVIERRASLMTEGDLTGLPYRGPKINGHESTKFNPPDWFLTACERPVILFFDEIDRAIPEVRQGIFQINDSRMLNGHKLHPLTRVVACINGGMHGHHYQVGDFDPAELDRYTAYDLEPTVEEWAEYCRNAGVLAEIINFCTEQPKHLEIATLGNDPTKITPSRRSWERLSETFKALPMFADGFEERQSEMIFMLASGYVGEESAIAFRQFAFDYKRLVTPDDVIFKGNLEALDSLGEAEFAEFAIDVAASEIMSSESLTEKNFSNIRQMIMKMPTEAMIVFWQQLCVSGNFTPENIEKLGWDFDNHETEEEQVEFTRILAERLIDPPEDVDLNKMIDNVQEKYSKKEEKGE